MSSVVRSVLGAALLLTGASAAIAASGTPPVAGQSVQAGASTATVASNNAPVAGQPQTGAVIANNAPIAYQSQSVQTGAPTALAASNSAPIADQPQKSTRSSVPDNNDPYGGHDPSSLAGVRTFFVPQY